VGPKLSNVKRPPRVRSNNRRAPSTVIRPVASGARSPPRSGAVSSRSSRAIYRRAHDRGEIDLDRVPPAVLAMPFELMRHDLLMNLEPQPPARIESIIDELFLPLVRSYHGGPGAGDR
jgi:tetracycline repressor-like protein